MFQIKNTVGTVNFSPYLHVTASKVSVPGAILWEDWFATPVSNMAFPIPVADADNYYIRYYEAADNVSLGTLHLELIVNALTGETLFERRFYFVGGPGEFDPAAGSNQITDPYLINKTVYGVFKEAFRYLQPTVEYNSNDLTGELNDLTGVLWAAGEAITVELKYNSGANQSTASGGLYSGSIEVPEAERPVLIDELNARFVCAGSEATQKFLLPLLAAVPDEAGYYFDNSVKGTALQPVIHCNGADKIKFNGFNTASDQFTDLWVSKGEHLLLRKRDGFWEVITDYKGVHVGEKATVGYKSHPGIITENGQLWDGDEIGRLWWWVKNVLPSNHQYVDDNVINELWIPDPERLGQFAVHSTQKKARMPKTCGLVQKGLANFETYGADAANRPVDYPGGYQPDMIKSHAHTLFFEEYATGLASNPGYDGGNNNYQTDISKTTSFTGGSENRVKNDGVIHARRI